MVTKPGDTTYSLSPASGGEGWGEGGRTTECNFITGHCCINPRFFKKLGMVVQPQGQRRATEGAPGVKGKLAEGLIPLIESTRR